MPPTDLNGWERWRGETNSDVRDLKADVRELLSARADHDKRIVSMETKMLVLAFVAAAAGSMIPSAIAAIFK